MCRTHYILQIHHFPSLFILSRVIFPEKSLLEKVKQDSNWVCNNGMGDVQSITTINAGAIGAENRAPLTTIFTPRRECLTRWFYHESSTARSFIMGSSDKVILAVSTSTVVHSPKVVNSPSYGFTAGLMHQYFIECRPYSAWVARYSPGVCPSGSVPNRITLYDQLEIWGAQCCSR